MGKNKNKTNQNKTNQNKTNQTGAPLSALFDGLLSDASLFDGILFDGILFDGILGRNALMATADKLRSIRQIKQLLHADGKVVLAESVPKRAQKLSELLDHTQIEPELYEQLGNAESYLFNNPKDPMINWDATDLQHSFETAGFVCQIEVTEFSTEVLVTSNLLERWLGMSGKYCDRLVQQGLSTADIKRIQAHFTQQLQNQTVFWNRSIVFVKAVFP